MTKKLWRGGFAVAASLALAASAVPGAALAQDGDVEVLTYFSSALGDQFLAEILEEYEASSGATVNIGEIDHEQYKTLILVQLAGGNPPDVLTDWAGARTAFKVGNGSLAPIDDMWEANELDAVFPAAMVESAATYDGSKYLIPFGYHVAGMFYNVDTLAEAGVDVPTTWDELIAACGTLNEAGITPIAIGSMNRWPAQFWFDYLLLRTAGPEYRASLMAGEASYEDAEVVAAMEMWAEAAAAGCFTNDANAFDWTDAAADVASGEAAMNLMGTWITGTFAGMDPPLEPITGYDFFEFPTIDPDIPNAVVGPVDGFAVAAEAKNLEGGKALLAFLTDPEVQTTWALGQGAIPPNVNSDTSALNDVMKKALDVANAASSFNFNYDLSTAPAPSEIGLDMFAKFMADPGQDIAALLAETQSLVQAAFEQQ